MTTTKAHELLSGRMVKLADGSTGPIYGREVETREVVTGYWVSVNGEARLVNVEEIEPLNPDYVPLR